MGIYRNITKFLGSWMSFHHLRLPESFSWFCRNLASPEPPNNRALPLRRSPSGSTMIHHDSLHEPLSCLSIGKKPTSSNQPTPKTDVFSAELNISVFNPANGFHGWWMLNGSSRSFLLCGPGGSQEFRRRSDCQSARTEGRNATRWGGKP